MKTKPEPSKETATSTDAITPALPRKLGANHSDTAKSPRKRDNNFKQSTDLREDRGIRQFKTNPKNRPQKG